MKCISLCIYNEKGVGVLKPKILMVCCNGFENGGIQAVIMSIVNNLNHEYEFDAISFTPGEQHHSEQFLKHGNIYHFKNRSFGHGIKKNLSEMTAGSVYAHEFDSFLNTHGPYVAIHCHNYFESAPFLRIAAKHGIPVRIAHSHNVESTFKRRNPLYPFLEKYYKSVIKKYCTNRIACSKAAGQYLFDNNEVSVVYNAIDLDKFNPALYNAQSSPVTRFIHVGRFSRQKNQSFLLEVFAEYHKLDQSAVLDLIGFGYEKEDIENIIKKYSLEQYVRVLSGDSNVAEYYAQADAMIFPSVYEGLGISIIEAQAMGLRCYISEVIQPEARLGLCKELKLEDGAKAWAEYIFEDIKNNGKEKCYVDMSRYDIKSVVKQYQKIYRGVGSKL